MVALRRHFRKELLDKSLVEDNIRSSLAIFNRRIINFDGETCWLNVTIQMLLCAMDYSPHHTMYSTLGKELLSAQTQDCIDSRTIKFLLQSEIESNATRFQDILIGYQDTRDALIILGENSQSWPDVYDLIFHTTQSSVTCHSCESKSEGGAIIQKLYTEIICPDNNSNLKNELEKLFNQGEDIEYRCESCGILGSSTKKEQIITEGSSGYLVICVKRSEESYGNQLKATDDVNFIDSNGFPRTYTPISIIFHRGGIEPRAGSIRHYLCDVKSKYDQRWYRTSDESLPEVLDEPSVTKMGYVILYRQKFHN